MMVVESCNIIFLLVFDNNLSTAQRIIWLRDTAYDQLIINDQIQVAKISIFQCGSESHIYFIYFYHALEGLKG